MTGSALGAPLAGMAIDHGGAALGLAVVALVGLAVALGAGGLRQGRRVLLARRLGPPLATTEDSAGTIREVQHENRVRATR